MELIQNITFSGNQATFSSIPQTFRDLILVVDVTGNGGSFESIVRMNGDTGFNYRWTRMGNIQGNAQGIAGNDSYIDPKIVTAPGMLVMQIFDYSTTDKNKSILFRSHDSQRMWFGGGRWSNNSAINQVSFAGFGTTTFSGTLSLYGIVS